MPRPRPLHSPARPPHPQYARRPQRPRRSYRPHRDDVLIAVAGLLGGVFLWGTGLQAGPPLLGVPAAMTLVSLAVMSGTELLRRTAPCVTLPIATSALALDVIAGSLVATIVMFTDVVYATVVYGPPAVARHLPRLALLLSLLATLVPLAVFRTPESMVVGVLLGLIAAGPAFTGAIVRFHREEAAAERLRAEQTALLAEMDRAQAVTAERARMARELHDMVANHLSAIAIHSTAALALPEDDPAGREALGVIRENSVQGLTEMRRLIGILRDAGGAEEPAASPTLDGLDALLDRVRATADPGFTFALHDDRDADTKESLPAPVELAAYRVVQESLTNALKHSAPGPVTVRIFCAQGPAPPVRAGRGGRGAQEGQAGGTARPLVVRVTNPLGATHRPRAPGSGAGLIGMRERVELLHGRLRTGPVDAKGGGPDADRVWEVRAELPVEEP